MFSLSPFAPLRIWSRETALAAPPRVSPLNLHTQAESDWLVLTQGTPPAFGDGVHVYRQPPMCRRYRVCYYVIRNLVCTGTARFQNEAYLEFRKRARDFIIATCRRGVDFFNSNFHFTKVDVKYIYTNSVP